MAQDLTKDVIGVKEFEVQDINKSGEPANFLGSISLDNHIVNKGYVDTQVAAVTPVDHTDSNDVSNVGTNTHAQVDTHLALTNEHIDWTNATQDFLTTGDIGGKELSLSFGTEPSTFNITERIYASGAVKIPELSFQGSFGFPLATMKNGLYLRGVTADPNLLFMNEVFTNFALITYDMANDHLDFASANEYSFDNDVRMEGDLFFTGSGSGLPYGTISVVSNANETTITTQNVYVQVVDFDTNGPNNNSTPDHTNDHITITKAGDYKIECHITANSVAGAGATFEFEIKKNNGASRVGSAHGDRTLSGGGSEAGSITIGDIVTLAVDDTIELWTKNESNTQNIIIEDASLSVVQVGG